MQMQKKIGLMKNKNVRRKKNRTKRIFHCLINYYAFLILLWAMEMTKWFCTIFSRVIQMNASSLKWEYSCLDVSYCIFFHDFQISIAIRYIFSFFSSEAYIPICVIINSSLQWVLLFGHPDFQLSFSCNMHKQNV